MRNDPISWWLTGEHINVAVRSGSIATIFSSSDQNHIAIHLYSLAFENLFWHINLRLKRPEISSKVTANEAWFIGRMMWKIVAEFWTLIIVVERTSERISISGPRESNHGIHDPVAWPTKLWFLPQKSEMVDKGMQSTKVRAYKNPLMEQIFRSIWCVMAEYFLNFHPPLQPRGNRIQKPFLSSVTYIQMWTDFPHGHK